MPPRGTLSVLLTGGFHPSSSNFDVMTYRSAARSFAT